MLTTRSSVFLLISGIAVFFGLLRGAEAVTLAGLTMLIWLAFQWWVVQWAIRSPTAVVGDLRRCLDNESQAYYTLPVQQSCQVQLTGQILRGYRGFRISLRDVLPDACGIVDGYTRLTFDLRGEGAFQMTYQILPQACGRMDLAGVMLTLEDPNGMFRGQRYLPLPQQLTVLPFLIRPQTTASALKVNNVQQVIGHHRHKRPGLSSELLEIRDYQTGDPPRAIAWKPTARLGRLMSCEYESVVPIRSSVFADLASYQFAGRPGGSVADRIITAAASVARLLLSDRDPVACVLATEKGSTRLPHGQGERQLSRLMHYLLAAADPSPRLDSLSDEDVIRVVFRECYRRYPQLFDRRVSFVPLGRSLFRPLRGKLHRIKCRLAPVLAELLDMPPGHSFRLIHDAAAIRAACLAWCRQHPVVTVRIRPSLRSDDDRSRLLTNEVLCKRLLEAHARAKDNELFVIIGCWPQSPTQAGRLLDVIRLCRTAGHRVIAIDGGLPDNRQGLQDPLARAVWNEYQECDEQLIPAFAVQELNALGVRYAQIQDPRLMETVAIEVDLIRSGKFRGRAGGQSVQFAPGVVLP